MKKPIKVLVIDDDVILLRRIDSLLSRNEFDVITARNGGDGIRFAFEREPDIILCDIMMPGVGGYNVFDILRQACVVYSTPFIFMSGHGELKEVRKGMLLGADDYIIKPFEDNELLNTITGRIQKSQRLKSLILEDLRKVLDFSTDGLFLSFQDKFVEVNASLCKILGYSENDLNGKSLIEFFNDSDAFEIKNWLSQVKNGINVTYKKFLRLKTKNGTITGNFYAMPVKGYLIAKATVLGIFQTLEKKDVIPENGESNFIETFNEEEVVEIDLGFDARFRGEMPEIDLSPREKEVLVLSCRGLTIREVADKLFISGRTVEKYRSTLIEKFSAKNFIEVALIALKLKLIKIR
ncbi:MAG: response regulator [Bacteroidales bacterium]